MATGSSAGAMTSSPDSTTSRRGGKMTSRSNCKTPRVDPDGMTSRGDKVTSSRGDTVTSSRRGDEVVISGMSCRLPESDGVDEFWRNLASGEDMVTDDDRRWPEGERTQIVV